MTATFYVGDAVTVMNRLPEKSVDLVLTSPPFLALRSYLPADHPDKALEGGSQSTPGAFIDWLIDVVEACDRVLAPHGSLCIELGDTYAGSGGAGGDYKENGLREGQPAFKANRGARSNKGITTSADMAGKGENIGGHHLGGTGWPLAKSLSLIPELFRLTLVYGFNPLTGRQTDRWRLRNVVRWVRPNPPVGALGDKFRPATSELMVFCKSAKRYFDLDAVRDGNYKPRELKVDMTRVDTRDRARKEVGLSSGKLPSDNNPGGAPPLDWWEGDALSGVDGMFTETEPGSSRPPDVLGNVSEGSTPGSVAPRNIPLLDGEEETRYGPKLPKPDPGIRRRSVHLVSNPSRGDFGDLNERIMHSNPAGAPPLDWWNIPPGGYEGAHYAVFPPELCVKPVKAMCPEKVCRQCGEPSRRIVSVLNRERQRIAELIINKREALGLQRRDLVPLFIGHYKNVDSVIAQISNWELAKNVPVPHDWKLLRERLGINTNEFDDLIEADLRWNDAEYVGGTLKPRVIGDFMGSGSAGKVDGGITRINQTLGFSDCGHDDWRPGLVLDPFAGSGTTGLVATGHGRDAILIDLDERNYELALQRVGPFILSRAESV